MSKEVTSERVGAIAGRLSRMSDGDMRRAIAEKGEAEFFKQVRSVAASAMTQRPLRKLPSGEYE